MSRMCCIQFIVLFNHVLDMSRAVFLMLGRSWMIEANTVGGGLEIRV